MPNVQAYLYYAVTNPQNEAAWIAVKEFPGASDEQQNRARTALGLIYLKSNRRDLAEATFRSVSEVTKFRADGLVGLALVAHSNGDVAEAKKLLPQVDDTKVGLFPEIVDAYKDLRQRLSPPK
jgi:hypothetical protein